MCRDGPLQILEPFIEHRLWQLRLKLVEKVSWLRELDDSLKATRTAVAANINATVTRGAAKLNLERASLPALPPVTCC